MSLILTLSILVVCTNLEVISFLINSFTVTDKKKKMEQSH